MDIEREVWRVPVPPAVGRSSGQPEWHALRARFVAAQEARMAMQQPEARSPLRRGGSFESDAAEILSSIRRRLEDVNRNDSANRNGEQDKDDPVAGESRTGDRG